MGTDSSRLRVVMPRETAGAIGGGFPLPPPGSQNYPSTWKDFSTVKTYRQPLGVEKGKQRA